MQQLSAFLGDHWAAASVLGGAFIVVGILLLSRRGARNVGLRAQSRGVVVNGDSFGPIVTGNSVEKQQSSSRDWIDISGVVIAILGTVIAALAWLLPRAPQ